MHLQTAHFAYLPPSTQQGSPVSLSSSHLLEDSRLIPYSSYLASRNSNSLSSFEFAQPKVSYVKQTEGSYYVRSPTLLHSQQCNPGSPLAQRAVHGEERRNNIAFASGQLSGQPRPSLFEYSSGFLKPFSPNGLQVSQPQIAAIPPKSGYTPKIQTPIPSRTSRVVRMVVSVTDVPRINPEPETPKLQTPKQQALPQPNMVNEETQREIWKSPVETLNGTGRTETRESSVVTIRKKRTESPEFNQYRPITRNSESKSSRKPQGDSFNDPHTNRTRLFLTTAPDEQVGLQRSLRKPLNSQRPSFKATEFKKNFGDDLKKMLGKLQEAASKNRALEAKNANLISQVSEYKEKYEASERENRLLAKQLATLTEQLEATKKLPEQVTPDSELTRLPTIQSQFESVAPTNPKDLHPSSFTQTNAGIQTEICQQIAAADKLPSTESLDIAVEGRNRGASPAGDQQTVEAVEQKGNLQSSNDSQQL